MFAIKQINNNKATIEPINNKNALAIVSVESNGNSSPSSSVINSFSIDM